MRVIEITASSSRKTNLGNYESEDSFFALKEIIDVIDIPVDIGEMWGDGVVKMRQQELYMMCREMTKQAEVDIRIETHQIKHPVAKITNPQWLMVLDAAKERIMQHHIWFTDTEHETEKGDGIKQFKEIWKDATGLEHFEIDKASLWMLRMVDRRCFIINGLKNEK